MKSRRLSRPPGTVTAEYTVRFLKPSPMDMPWRLRAWATKVEGSKVSVAGELEVAGERTATMRGVFAAVKEGHPAFRRWQ
jgi:acyl-CoA thioesterase FadM